MARKNRVSVYDGIYHVTTRIANRAMLLAEDEVKDKVLELVVSVARFSGVELWAFCIMDNHLHLFVRVPPVPEDLWLDPSDEPVAYAFGMRPPECREPLWSPDGDSPRAEGAPDGDSPLSEGSSAGDSPRLRRPAPGFMLDDEAMLDRLEFLYGPDRAERIGKCWAMLREHGNGFLVDEEKERYCRRMYNLSQFVKTLKERVSSWYNAAYGHAGTLWEGHFHSGVVEKDAVVKAVVAAYIGYNPAKARLVADPAGWKWSSYALAVAGDCEYGAYCRGMYERMLGRPWEEVRATLESMFADRLPESVSPEDLKKWYDDYDDDAENERPGGVYRASQAIRASLKLFTGAFIGRDKKFLKRVASCLPAKFPRAGSRSIRRCRAFLWGPSAPLAQAA